MYLVFKKRRWKEKGEIESFNNNYKLHPKGIKTTHAFSIFLKELDRKEINEFFNSLSSVRHIEQEDFCLV